MKTRSLWRHLWTVLSIVIVSYVLFTFFPSIFPHPEDFSNYSEIVAFITVIVVLMMIRDGKRRWFLLPIVFICLLALLDEIGYGSEVNLVKPFYSQSLHTEIRDLHNLITIAMDLGSQALEKAHWNTSLFADFLFVDGILLMGGLFFGWLLRFRIPNSEEKIHNRILWLTALFWLISGFATAGYLLSLPQDPKNAFLFGHSITRLLSLVVTFLLSIAPIAILMSKRNSPGFINSLSNWFRKHLRAISFSGIILMLAIFYQFYVPFIFLPDQLVLLERVTSLVLWMLAITWFTLLCVQSWRGDLREPISDFFIRFLNFLRHEPAYFYMISAVFLILIAQLIDKDVIPLNSLIQAPKFHINLWGLWTEETFEMNASFLLLVAAFYFPKQK
jgi:hypothetical protein